LARHLSPICPIFVDCRPYTTSGSSPLWSSRLLAAGFLVEREVRVRKRWCLDLLATKDNRTGIEIKLDRRGLLDDILKARTLVRLPEVDEMFVCGPKVFMSEDVRALAASLGIGLVA